MNLMYFFFYKYVETNFCGLFIPYWVSIEQPLDPFGAGLCPFHLCSLWSCAHHDAATTLLQDYAQDYLPIINKIYIKTTFMCIPLVMSDS